MVGEHMHVTDLFLKDHYKKGKLFLNFCWLHENSNAWIQDNLEFTVLLYFILSRVGCETVDRVWIGEWIY
jgi:hypothetical protein